MVERHAGHDRYDSNREIPLVLRARKRQRPFAIPRPGSVTVNIVCYRFGCRITGRSHLAEPSADRKVTTTRQDGVSPTMTQSTSTQTTTQFTGGNYLDKYRSKNPIHRMLMRVFLSSARDLLSKIEYKSGGGRGDLATIVRFMLALASPRSTPNKQSVSLKNFPKLNIRPFTAAEKTSIFTI